MRDILPLAILAVLIGGCTAPGWQCFRDSDCPPVNCIGVIPKCDVGRCVNIYSNGTLANLTNCNNVSIPNPAAEYCIEKGYTYGIETDAEGGQAGYCYLSQSSMPGYVYKCDEWKFYRGECPTCQEFCEALPRIECVGYWGISGEFPNCKCQYSCSTTGVCSSDSDCPTGYACYNSRFCSTIPDDIVCGDQEGDLLCHKLCDYSSDCPSDMPYCRSVSITQGDTISMRKMCMQDECTADSDCPQPRCPGVKSICVDGRCKFVDSSGSPARCTTNYTMGKELCEEYGGHWNECGSACTGQPPGTACIAVCIAQCECGGIAGWQCPPGYYCMRSSYKADELGVCRLPTV